MLTVPTQTLTNLIRGANGNQSAENPNNVALKGSFANWLRFVKWTKGISTDDTTIVQGSAHRNLMSRALTRGLHYRSIGVEVFGTYGRAPASFDQAARGEISCSIRRRTVRSAKSRS
jgi:hypothetical protein